MFSYQMVSHDIAQLMDLSRDVNSAIWQAICASGKDLNPELCALKLQDAQMHLKSLQKQFKDLELKIEYLKNQG